MSGKEKEEEEEEERDWSELPSDLLHVIAKKLPDLLDFICFRATCKIWRSSAPLSDPLQYQLPWLLELFERSKYFPGLRKRQRYHAVSSGRTFTIRFKTRKPILETWAEKGFCSQYLAFHNGDGTMSLLNPLTKDKFSIHGSCPTVMVGGRDVDTSLHNDDDIVDEWSSFDPHNNTWVTHKEFFYERSILERMYFQGRPTYEDSPVRDELGRHLREDFLINSSQGILKVLWFHDWHKKKSVKLSVFHVYRLDDETADGKPCWVRIPDIGDEIIFLDKANGFSVTATASSGFRQGCIYFIYPEHEKPYVYDVLAGTVEEMPCPFKMCTWFLPGLG